MTLTPLDGYTIGVTADRRWEEQAELLRRRGAEVLHGPSIRTLPLGPERGLRLATDEVIARPPDFVIANTGIGMRSWFAAADSWGIFDALYDAVKHSAIYARGPKAAGAAHQLGLDVKGKAASERLDEVLAMLQEEELVGKRIAFQRHGEDAPELLESLKGTGAEVLEIPVYQWTLPDSTTAAMRLVEAVIERRVQAVTFTSAPALRNLIAIAEEHGRLSQLVEALNTDVVSACVGPVCAQAANTEGISEVIVPDRWRLGPMIRALSDHLSTSSRRFHVNGIDLELRGSVLVLDGQRVPVSPRERAVLGVLLGRAGSVVSKSELLTRVWGDAVTDEHTVEVTVARLRQRLGPAGVLVRAIPRRGYLWQAPSSQPG